MTYPESEQNLTEPVEIHYQQGTLSVYCNYFKKLPDILTWLQWDQRTLCHRCHADKYRELFRYLYKNNIRYSDFTPKYNKLDLLLKTDFTPFDYQSEALNSWKPTKRGITVLPTGTGKSFLAALAIQLVQRSTLVLAPTIDLILQWQKNLSDWFQYEVGLLGGGSFELADVTVSTYDSARIYAENIGNRFCLIIYDECHHLPSPAYSQMTHSYIAPYKLGLTATPSIEPDRQQLLKEILGPVLYSKQIQQLSGDYLAPYQIKTIEVELTDEERDDYEYHRQVYETYRSKVPSFFGKKTSWERFVMYAYRSAEGRNAIRSFNLQKQISLSANRKMEELANILIRHNDSRILIFTNDNKTAYHISSLFLLPLITHETKAKERKLVLEKFRAGDWPFLVNSRVLNEGVDVPEANIAVVISGTATVREHVQRLGRILRKKDNKTALLYEIITANTGEVYTSKKRRVHGAYEQFS
ncbi:DEAD/DEAH box helicase family protein [bacterium]|nr:DEAD/DEAH box helicase family protein [bacterium]